MVPEKIATSRIMRYLVAILKTFYGDFLVLKNTGGRSGNKLFFECILLICDILCAVSHRFFAEDDQF